MNKYPVNKASNFSDELLEDIRQCPYTEMLPGSIVRSMACEILRLREILSDANRELDGIKKQIDYLIKQMEEYDETQYQ